ncbi:MAG: hypothetical protein KDJ88_00330 [Bauldia sp.]|nr:hypothetical protein [Bauldia sp.]
MADRPMGEGSDVPDEPRGEEETRGEEEPGKVRTIDLVLGAWRPREAATQLAAALAVKLPEARHPASEAEEIDSAAIGDTGILYAHEAARRIARVLPAQNGVVALLTPRFGLPLRSDNEWFFHFLKRFGIAIAIIGPDPRLTSIAPSIFERRGGIPEPGLGGGAGSLPEEKRRLLRFFPGLLPRVLAAERDIAIGAAFLVPVGTEHFLIPPAWRDTDPAAASLDLDAMAELGDGDDGMAAFAERHCTAHFADSAKLRALSQRFERAGSMDIAVELAERARHVARDPEAMALADIRRQELNRRMGRFEAMADQPPASRRASEAARFRLDRLRVRGAIGTGGAAGHDGGLAPLVARLHSAEALSAEEIIILDDHAAARTATEPDLALERAEAVRDALAASPEADRRLVFRNAMTLARLHGARGEADAARRALERAFATSRGIRSLGEVVEMNVRLALAGSEATAPAARLAWLRAALAWLAFDPPEAAPDGVVRALLGDRDDHVRARFDIDISDAIADRLEAAWPDLKAVPGGEYPAVRAMAADDRPRRMVGGPGAVIGMAEASSVSPVYVRARVRLLRLAEAALATLCPAFPRSAGGVWLVDANLGLDIPATREEALSAALRTRTDELVFGEETIALDAGARTRHIGRLVAGRAPAVISIAASDGGELCRFGRHRPDVALTAEQTETLAPLLDNPRMALGPLAVILGRTASDTERRLREVEALGPIRLDIEARPDTVTAAPEQAPEPSPEPVPPEASSPGTPPPEMRPSETPPSDPPPPVD